jgi:hypothetical protein
MSVGGGLIGGPTRHGVSLSSSYQSPLAWWLHAPDHVATVAPDVDVLRLLREEEGVHGEVRLQEAAVGLGFHEGKFDLLGGTRRSSQGDISATSRSGSGPKSSWATICWVQVVPDLA